MSVVARIEREETKQLAYRALIHYLQRVRNLGEDNKIRFGDDVIRRDMEREAKETEKALEMLKVQEENHLAPYIRETKLLKTALACYITDLKAARESLKNNLGDSLGLPETNEELKVAQDLLDAVEK